MTDLVIKVIIFSVLAGILYFMGVYNKRWHWRGTIAGRVIMGMAAGLLSSAVLSSVGETWPNWHYRPVLRVLGWGAILGIVVVADIAMTRIKKPPDD